MSLSSACEGEDLFFETSDSSFTVNGDTMCSNSCSYDIWLSEPKSVKERREAFLSRMGFCEPSSRVECENSTLSDESENLLSERRKSNSEANCSVDYSDHDWLDDDDVSYDTGEEINENLVHCDDKMGGILSSTVDKKNKNVIQWWRHLMKKMKKKSLKPCDEVGCTTRVRVEQNKKRYMECSGLFRGQEIVAHDGLIWTMKFSPDGKYLASGGEDGVVCIWRVTTVDPSCKSDDIEGNLSHVKKKLMNSSVLIPEKIFHVEEEPVRRFRGHSSDVLDLAWSTSNHLLSSSMDKTVRLWQVGSDECLGVFHHNNYVTCVQFNPVDENYFITGSIDGKVRIWGMTKKRVEDWANARDIVTAVCYQPNGNGFVVGSVSGTCRFYELSGDGVLLNAEINFQGRKTGNRITGIQFLKNDSQRVMITSDDSKIRILDGLEVVCKYKGLTKSGIHMSASFTSNGKHIVSVGDDSCIYLWNYDDLSIQASKHPKSTRSCEHFSSQGITVALPWSDPDTLVGHESSPCPSSRNWDSERFSLANWFSMDGSSRATITWPEEKLPVWDSNDCHFQDENDGYGLRTSCTMWGLVFVTANCDGTIRTFHNYGLPVRV